MPLLRRSLLLVALVIQAAFGPAGLTLDVCHGRLQWAAPAGESCCGAIEAGVPLESACDCDHDHGAPRPAAPAHEPISMQESESCPTCFQVALEGSDNAFESRGLDLAPALAFCQIVPSIELAPAPAKLASSHTSRAPPGAVPPPGLLPGTFPLRI
ncbi:MAG: hypothetical protein ACJAQ3_003218 [Planctomycetota bacterium]|jgi:hypothetical protein